MVLIRFSVAFANAQFWAVLLPAPAFRGSLEWLHQPLDRLLGQEPAAALGRDLKAFTYPAPPLPDMGQRPSELEGDRGLLTLHSQPASHPHFPSFNLELPQGEKEKVTSPRSFQFSVKVGTEWAVSAQNESAEKREGKRWGPGLLEGSQFPCRLSCRDPAHLSHSAEKTGQSWKGEGGEIGTRQSDWACREGQAGGPTVPLGYPCLVIPLVPAPLWEPHYSDSVSAHLPTHSTIVRSPQISTHRHSHSQVCTAQKTCVSQRHTPLLGASSVLGTPVLAVYSQPHFLYFSVFCWYFTAPKLKCHLVSLRSGWLCGNCRARPCSLFRNHHADRLTRQQDRFTFPPAARITPSPTLVIFCFSFLIAILVGVEWCLTLVAIGISLRTRH